MHVMSAIKIYTQNMCIFIKRIIIHITHKLARKYSGRAHVFNLMNHYYLLLAYHYYRILNSFISHLIE